MKDRRALYVGLIAIALTGCGEPSTSLDAGPRDAGSESDGGPPPGDAGMFDAGPIGDGNDSIETAEALMDDGEGYLFGPGDLDSATDVDFFRFESFEGELVYIVGGADGVGPPGYLNTVITLFDEAGNQIARNDDRYPFPVSSTAELLTILPSTGAYFVQVQDYCQTPEGALECDDQWFAALENREFQVTLYVFDPVLEGIVFEAPEPNETETDAAVMEYLAAGSGRYIETIAGGFWNGDDVDAIVLEVPVDLAVVAGTRAQAFFAFAPQGTRGSGGSIETGVVSIVDIATSSVIGSLDFSTVAAGSGRPVLMVPVVPGSRYLLSIANGPPADDGSAPFYILTHAFRDGAVLEDDEPANDLGTTPELIETADAENAYHVEGNLADGDRDHFGMSVIDDVLAVVCDSAGMGSGISLRGTIFAADGVTVLGAATEAPVAGQPFRMEGIDVSGQTNVIVKLEPIAQSTTVVSDWYRCAFQFSPAP